MGQKQSIQALLDLAGTGITINGNKPWDPQVHNPQLYGRVLAEGSLGFGEGYMDKWWDCGDLPELFARFHSSHFEAHLLRAGIIGLKESARRLGSSLINRQTKERSLEVGRVHYDDRTFNAAALGELMVGTCANYERGAATLDEAQRDKVQVIGEKLHLKKDQTLLDIGCGWGYLMHYLHDRFGVIPSGVTISKDQAAYAGEHFPDIAPGIILKDYRDYAGIPGGFDRITSVGMFEHVGRKNWLKYFNIVRKLLKPDGIFLLHTIVGGRREFATDRYVDRYIFPGGELPTMADIFDLVEGTFVVEDLHNLGTNYERTLRDWAANFKARRAEVVREYGDRGERTARMYEFYLGMSEGGFRARTLNVIQVVLSPEGVKGGYQSVR